MKTRLRSNMLYLVTGIGFLALAVWNASDAIRNGPVSIWDWVNIGFTAAVAAIEFAFFFTLHHA